MQGQIVTAKLLDPLVLLKDMLGLKPGHQLGDFGCGGAGYFSLPAARLVGSQGKVYSIDILKSALDSVVGKARLENIVWLDPVWSDLERPGATKIPEATLDNVLLINVMFQSRDNQSILKEAARLLKTGGRVLVIDWKVEPTPFGPPMKNRLTPEQILELAAKLGFKLDNRFEAGPYHYGLILVKN